ncbi:hypothetical protein HGO34_15585 [Agrobacterium vitis]|uniref:hypothetical protein n=1 Tax=Agrobacterium vitis TaxID=373 RepID=UPI002033F8D4|nr:hypothetical protein [Agrobacterium vitis]MCM2441143.1 hypothetical protein [Agrobacterium vitis]
MTEQSMIERVARAISQADERNGGPPYEYRITLGKHAKNQLFDEARAAIEAMRKLTEEMRWAAITSPLPSAEDNRPLYEICYDRMIDAALKKGD